MEILLLVTHMLSHVLGWTAPNVRNPVVRATVVNDRVMIPVTKRDEMYSLADVWPLRILDQPIYRAGPATQLYPGTPSDDDLLPGAYRPRGTPKLRIDRHNLHWASYSPFGTSDHYDQHTNPVLLCYMPLEIVRYLNTTDRDQSDKTRESVRSLTSKFRDPPLYAHGRSDGVRTQFDYLPVKDGKFEWYYSGMTAEKFGGKERRFSVLRWIKLPALGDQKYRSEESDWATPFAKDWSEGFTVLGVKDDRFFVTSAGRLFMAPRAQPTGGTLKLLPTELPIRVLIHDTDTDKHYAFTAATYFEIAETIQPRPHALPISPPLSSGGQLRDGLKAIEIAARCARLIRGLPEPAAK